MAASSSIPTLLLLFLCLFGTSVVLSFTLPSNFLIQPTNRLSSSATKSSTQTYLFGSSSSGTAKIPSSQSERDNGAIASIKSAISNPRIKSCPLIECEFPALSALNKLGDGSLRSSLEAEDANISFVNKLVGGISTPFFGPNISLVISSSASNAFINKVQKKVKGATLISLKDGNTPGILEKKDNVCIFLTPSSPKDYQAARTLAEYGCATVLVNGSFKVCDCCHGILLLFDYNLTQNICLEICKYVDIFGNSKCQFCWWLIIAHIKCIIYVGSKECTSRCNNGLFPKTSNIQFTSGWILNQIISKFVDCIRCTNKVRVGIIY